MVRKILQPCRTRQEASPPELPPSRLSPLLLRPAACLTEAEREGLEGFLHINPLLPHKYQLNTCFQTLLAEGRTS
jgi:hypothetical protein